MAEGAGRPTIDAEGAALIAKLRARDPDAFRLIDLLYTRRLIGLARVRLPAILSSKIDPDDVVQSVLRSFFLRNEKGEFDELNNPESCWRVLAKITRRKCGRKADHFFSAKRSPLREAQVEQAWESVAQGPSPEEAAILIETVAEISRDFAPHQVAMLDLLLEGRSADEVAKTIGYSKRMVERFKQKLWNQLNAMLADGPEAD